MSWRLARRRFCGDLLATLGQAWCIFALVEVSTNWRELCPRRIVEPRRLGTQDAEPSLRSAEEAGLPSCGACTPENRQDAPQSLAQITPRRMRRHAVVELSLSEVCLPSVIRSRSQRERSWSAKRTISPDAEVRAARRASCNSSSARSPFASSRLGAEALTVPPRLQSQRSC